MTTHFKCIVDYEGGVQHEKDSHRAMKYRLDGTEFRLIPRSSMPSKFTSLWDKYDLRQPKVTELEDGVMEENTYFLRKAEDNPLEGDSWLVCTLTTLEQFFSQEQIVCGQESDFPNELFRLNLTTKKFVYAYLGSWDNPLLREGYYGDSSVFSFGQCRPYYD